MQPPPDAELSYPLRPPHPMSALRRTVDPGMCKTCLAETNYTCSACSTPAYYCSPQHILEDWASHSMECDAVTILTMARAAEYSLAAADRLEPEPGPDEETLSHAVPSGCVRAPPGITRTVRAIYANPATDTLTFVNVPVLPHADGQGWFAFLVEYLADPAMRTVVAFGSSLKPRTLPFAVYFNVDEYSTRRTVNTAIATLTADCAPRSWYWYGPIVIMAVTDDPVVPDFGDIGYDDFGDIHDFFGWN